MNTDKLVKAIQIIVAEEVKRVVPRLVKEGVKQEMTKLLKENKNLRESFKQKPEPQNYSMASAILEDEVIKKFDLKEITLQY